MDEHLVGYLLNVLEPETHQQVAAWLETHPDGRERLERLRQVLAPLEAERAGIEPPPGLAVRTIARVAEHICRELPQAPPSPVQGVPSRAFWQRADVLVAACLLLTIFGLLLPLFFQGHNRADVVACQNTLREIHTGLKIYSDQKHNRLPMVRDAAEPPRDVAGLIVPMLIASGYLAPNFRVGCPAEDNPTPKPLKDILALKFPEFQDQAAQFTPCYAYSLGFRNEQGELQGLYFKPDLPTNLLPVMADKPDSNALFGNSPNHGDRGQNVLYMDGHVKFVTTRTVGINGDDIYLNKAKDVKAGLDHFDTVLGSSFRRP